MSQEHPHPPERPKSLISTRTAKAGSVAEIVRELMAEVRTRAETDRLEAKSRGPLTRLLLGLALVALTSAGVTTVYGILNFPNAPIRKTASGYVDKGGKARTQRDHENYLAWSRAMWITYPATFLSFAAFLWSDDRGRRNRRRAVS